MSGNWKTTLEAKLPEGDHRFRHEVSFVGASTIAQQYYCEAKVEQSLIHGEVPSETKDAGTELHDEVLAMERVERGELIEHIEKDLRVTASFRLFAEISKLRIVGVPDAVVFEKSVPKWLIELKTTRGDYHRFFNEQLVQVRIYGLLLEKAGFDCSDLKLALVRMRQEAELEPDAKKAMLTLIRVSLAGNKTEKLEQKFPLKFFVLPHDSSEAERSVTWAQDYWLGIREPIPTRYEGKCKVCEYNSVCPHSLYRPNVT